MKNLFARAFLGLLLVALGAFASAEDTQKFDQEQEAELAQKVKKRLYPGGKDESEIKVQPVILKPTRKISPTVEETPESATQDE